MPIKIDYEKCCMKDGKCSDEKCVDSCAVCVETCPVDAIKKEKIIVIDNDKCIDCGACAAVCKNDALELEY